jgi:HlyD family secretion protein
VSTSTIQTRRNGRTRLLILAVVLVTGGLSYYFYTAALTRKDAVERPEVVAKRTQVHALGRLEPTGTILQLVPKSGNEGAVVDRLLVKEGEDVAAGATLAILDNQARRTAALREAQAKLASAEARLQQVKAGAKAGDIEAQLAALMLTETQSGVASRELQRAHELQQKKAITEELLDQKQWEFDRLKIEQRRVRGLLDSLREVRDVDVVVAEKDIEAAQASVARAQADVDASTLQAPFAGRILQIHTHSGEKIHERGVLEMGDVVRMQAVAEVFEADVAMLAIGMKADIRLESSDAVISGHIVEVGNLVSRKIVLTNDPVSDTDARVIEVRIDLDPDLISEVTRLANARIEITIHLDRTDVRSTDASFTGGL